MLSSIIFLIKDWRLITVLYVYDSWQTDWPTAEPEPTLTSKYIEKLSKHEKAKLSMLRFARKSKFYGHCQKVPKRPKNDQRPNRKSCDRKALKTTNLVANHQKWQHCFLLIFSRHTFWIKQALKDNKINLQNPNI